MATGVAASNYLENKLLEHVLKNTAYTSPTAVHTALFTVAPDDTGGGTEVTGGSYAREATTFGAAASGSISNSADCDFGAATADWGTIVAVGIFDAATVGNLLYYGTLTVSKTVQNGDSFKFLATKLVVSMD
jgi:hypothetical protein